MSETGAALSETATSLALETTIVVENLRPLIKEGLEHPISPENLILGKSESGQTNIGLFDGFTKAEAISLFDILKDESKIATENDTAILHPEDLINHEMQHITVAEDLGVNLEECKLEVLFIKPQNPETPTKVVDLQINFLIPENTSPWIRLESSIAPDYMSDGDKNTFVEIVKKNKLILSANPVRAAGLLRRYREKNGVFPKIW